jgi:hypothetical protein
MEIVRALEIPLKVLFVLVSLGLIGSSSCR